MEKQHITNCRLYGFIDTGYLAGRKPGEVAKELITGGVDVIQVRAKKEKHAKLVEIAKAVVRAAHDAPVPVIVNDDIVAAYESGADGVHLGQEDWHALPRGERLQKLMRLEILGISTHSIDQALAAESEGANYIGVGPVFATATKPGRMPVGLGLVRQVATRVALPFFAIGGIHPGNLASVIGAGARRIAVVSAILDSRDVTKAASEIKKKLMEEV